MTEIDKINWYEARKEGLGDLYEGLLEKNANENKSGAGQYFTSLMEAIFNGHLDFAQMLVDRRANINDGSLYLLIDQRIDGPFTRMLLDRGADVNVVFNNGKIPPRITYPAIRYGPIPQGSTPLLAAARAQDVRLMKMLLDKHADPNKATMVDCFTPLMAALAGGAAEGRTGAESDAGGAVIDRARGGCECGEFARDERDALCCAGG